jgi:hypothetical protein
MGFCLDTWRISGSNGQKWQNRASGGWTPVPAGCRCEVGAPCHARTARMARFAPATRVPRSFAARACHARSQCTVRKLRGTRAVSRRAEAVRALCALRAFLTPWSTTRAKARPARMARFAPATRVPLSFAARACHALSQCTVRKLRGTRAVSRRAEAVRACSLLPVPCTLHLAPCTLHPAPAPPGPMLRATCLLLVDASNRAHLPPSRR